MKTSFLFKRKDDWGGRKLPHGCKSGGGGGTDIADVILPFCFSFGRNGEAVVNQKPEIKHDGEK